MTSPRPVSTAAQDTRRVQTAVVGPTADSKEGFELPTDHDQARAEYDPDAQYWCGTHQGGCGRRLYVRFHKGKVAHFYHHGVKGKECPLSERRRGSQDLDPVTAWAALSPWRQARGLSEGRMQPFDRVRGSDARYMHISGEPGERDTRVVIGNVTDDRVAQDAKSPRAREWDWFVHTDNLRVRRLLDKYGVSYGLIRFTGRGSDAAMEVFLTGEKHAGQWGRVKDYEPAPHREPRPAGTPSAPATITNAPAPPQLNGGVPTPRPALPQERFQAALLTSRDRSMGVLQRRRASRPLAAPRPKPKGRDKTQNRPVLQPVPSAKPVSKPTPAAADPYDERLDKEQQRLEVALTGDDREDIKQLARDLQKLMATDEAAMSPKQRKRIRNLLSQAHR